MITLRSFRDAIRVLFIYRQRVLAAFIAIILAVIAALFLTTPRYLSEAKLLVTLGRGNASLPVVVQDRPAAISQNFQRDQLIDETAMLQSREVVSAVAERWSDTLLTGESPSSFFGWIKHAAKTVVHFVGQGLRSMLVWLGLLDERDPNIRLLERLDKHFKVSHETGSGVLQLSIELEDPKLSQAVLQDWIDIYMELRLRLLSDTNVHAFYKAQVQSVKSEVESVERERDRIFNEFGTLDLAMREAAFSERIDRLRAEREEHIREIEGAKEGIASSKLALTKVPGQVVSEVVTSKNPGQSDLIEHMNDLLIEREVKRRTYTPDSEQLRSLDKSIKELRSMISAQSSYDRAGETKKRNPISVRISDEMLQDEIRIAELSAKLYSLDIQVEDLKVERARFINGVDRLRKLNRQLEVLDRSYDLYTSKLEISRVDLALDSNRISNVKLIEPPTYDPERSRPRTLLLLGMAPVLAIGFALFVAYLSKLIDQRIYDGEQLERVFGLPLLATIPDVPEGDDARNKQANAIAATVGMRQLVSRLMAMPALLNGGRVAFTSVRSGEGVTWVSERVRAALGESPIEIIDTPPLFASDAEPGQVGADCLVLIVESGRTTLPAVELSVTTLRAYSHDQLAGFVINRRPLVIPERIYQFLSGRRRQA